MRASFAIMAHPDRAWMVDELSDALGVDHTVHWDRRGDRWETGSRAWSAADKRAKWHVVIQDDAILCDDFTDRVFSFLETRKSQPVSFYLGAGRPRQVDVLRAISQAGDADALEMNQLIWGVCVALPRRFVTPMLMECSRGVPHYDTRMSQFFERRKIKTAYSWPSLVDHRDEPSLIYKNLATPRVAHRFAGSSRHWGTVPA